MIALLALPGSSGALTCAKGTPTHPKGALPPALPAAVPSRLRLALRADDERLLRCLRRRHLDVEVTPAHGSHTRTVLAPPNPPSLWAARPRCMAPPATGHIPSSVALTGLTGEDDTRQSKENERRNTMQHNSWMREEERAVHAAVSGKSVETRRACCRCGHAKR